jgi:hypothetical protein
MPSTSRARALLLCLLVLSPGAGCASTPGLWRAGTLRTGDPPLDPPRPAAEVEVYYKEGFGLLEAEECQRYRACATTTVLRRAFLVPEELRPGAPVGEPERDYDVVGRVTTEEFPRDEERSRIVHESFGSVFGIGTGPLDLFEVAIDPAFYPDALARLQALASELGADAVIEVFATGEAEHQMWEGLSISFDHRSTSSPIYVDGKLLDLELRDVRLHGVAIRYEQ